MTRFVLLLTAAFLYLQPCIADNRGAKTKAEELADSVRTLSQRIDTAYDKGHYATVELIYREYRQLRARVRGADYNFFDLGILRIYHETLLKKSDFESAREIAKEIDEIYMRNLLRNRDTIFRPLRLGISFAVLSSGNGPVSWSPQLSLGYHPATFSGFGLDLAAGYQRVPLRFNILKERGADNRYVNSGYTLEADGFMHLSDISVKLSYNLEIDPNRMSTLGVGGYVGFGYSYVHRTFLRKFYREYNYRDSIFSQTGSSYESRLMFNTEHYKNKSDFSLFETGSVFNLVAGLNIYQMPAKKFLLTCSLLGVYPLSKYRFSSIAESRRIGYFGLSVTASRLMMKRVIPTNRRIRGHT